MTDRITVGYPVPILFPNRNRGKHWSKTSGPKQRYKQEGFWQARADKLAAPPTETIRVILHAYPGKGRGRPDRDNFIAACKSLLDGIAEAIGVNDERFDPSMRRYPAGSGGPHGKVIVELQPG